jgi:hypothetical protein
MPYILPQRFRLLPRCGSTELQLRAAPAASKLKLTSSKLAVAACASSAAALPHQKCTACHQCASDYITCLPHSMYGVRFQGHVAHKLNVELTHL